MLACVCVCVYMTWLEGKREADNGNTEGGEGKREGMKGESKRMETK